VIFQYQQSDYTHRLHVFAVDFDGGQIGESLLQTVEGLNGQHGQPTWQPIRYDSGETYNSIYNKVWEGNSIWGAIIANSGVSNRLTSAITTESNDTYNANDALKIIFNESRYRTVGLSVIESNLIAAVSQTAITYQMSFGLENISLLPNNATAQNKVALMEPIGYSSINMQPFGFSATPLINTVMFVFPVLAQFFLVLVLNGVFGKSGAYGQWSLRSNLATRFFFGTVWSCIVGLSWASWIYIWKNGVAMGSEYFFMVWVTMWLYSALNFWVIDGVCSLVEMQWMPFFVLSWIICQVAGVISPPDLASRFYRVDYILPSHHTWGVLMTIFGHGANNHLGTNLTVCFVWLGKRSSGPEIEAGLTV